MSLPIRPGLATALALASLCACASPRQRDSFHLGPWEQEIGYAQAVRVGDRVYVSGSVGDPKTTLDEQLQRAYASIQKTLDHYGATFANVAKERIYTTDLEALIKAQETRKKIYGGHLPAATWVEVKRLYQPGGKIEIEVDLEL
jgi:enamine deaminase RidA (YjgF/YER057c/UK114 family)